MVKTEEGCDLYYYVYYSNPKREASLKKYCKYSLFAPAEATPPKMVRQIMTEEPAFEGPWEAGQLPKKKGKKPKKTKEPDWEHIYALAKEGKLEEIPAKIRVKYYINL